MRNLLNRIIHDHRWFIGTIIVLGIITLFCWKLINPASYANEINSFLKDMWTIFVFLIELFFICVGLAIIVGWRPFRKRGGGH